MDRGHTGAEWGCLCKEADAQQKGLEPEGLVRRAGERRGGAGASSRLHRPQGPGKAPRRDQRPTAGGCGRDQTSRKTVAGPVGGHRWEGLLATER